MASIDSPRPRVNASMLPQNQGKFVCLLGKVKNVDPDQTAFVMTTSDQQDVRVFLPEPLNDVVDGIIEVIGEVGMNCEIQCHNYVNFGDTDFDMTLYDEAIKMITDYPEYHQLAEG
ncbi:replication protein A 14 kDa subunit-like [Glandiceps talaboti]